MRYSIVSMVKGERVDWEVVEAEVRRVWALRDVEHLGLWKNVMVLVGVLILVVERWRVVCVRRRRE